jgi:large subunit ribosomal protein L2
LLKSWVTNIGVVSPTGVPAKGGRTRTRGKASNKSIVRRRRSRRYGVLKLK